jgi:REP element-mobilizing transposase RayT
MANTYTQIHIQVVFAVKGRAGLIGKEWKDQLYKYITGIIQKHNHKVLAINGVSDHIHILFGMRPTQSLSELMQDVKGSSSKFINDQKFLKSRFEWQEGYGAFSYTREQVPTVINYIKTQEVHHMHQSFQDEYLDLLEEFEVEYDERYVFKPVE